MVRRGGEAHFIPADMSRHVLIECRQFSVAPVFMEDVELECVALDLEVVQCRHGVGVVTGPADHSAELVTDLANDEVLLGRTYSKAQPHSDDVFLRQRRFPRARLNVPRARRSHALLVDGHGGNGRSLGKSLLSKTGQGCAEVW